MKITIALIKEVKRKIKKSWHDQEWHKFMNLKEVEAIIYALQDTKKESLDFSYIKRKALEYLKIIGN